VVEEPVHVSKFPTREPGGPVSDLERWPQGPRCESERSTTATHGDGKSDRLIVAEKRPNKEGGAPPSAEGVEPSGLAEGKTRQQSKFRTQRREGGDMEYSKRARNEKSWTQPRDTPTSRLWTCKMRWGEYGRRTNGRNRTITLPNNVCASLPEAGAQCGKAARWDLRGGCPERGIPTATNSPVTRGTSSPYPLRVAIGCQGFPCDHELVRHAGCLVITRPTWALY